MPMLQGPFRSRQNIILASASPRRQQLLSSLGLDFEVRPSRMTEDPPGPGEDPTEFVVRNARLKASDKADAKHGAVVLGADTVVVQDDRILGKPENPSESQRVLELLSGKTHAVITGCCLRQIPDGLEQTFHVRTDVRMAHTSPAFLRSYIATGEGTDKAGGYAIQGVGAFLVEAIHGSYTNVVGLPLTEVCRSLLELGAIRCAEPEEIASPQSSG